MGNKCIVLLDGTWNDPQDATNVYRLAQHIVKQEDQVFFYDPGVGTSSFEKIRGGAFGFGLTKNLLQSYEWLAKQYRGEGDEIWIFGFSRGAYTARSLVGLIRKCGLLRIFTPGLLEEAERIYRDKEAKPDSHLCKGFREQHSFEARVKFIGVWDTVGALGIPGTNLSERGRYSWHDTELSKIVDYAFHAVALDEHREAYDVPLWTSSNGQKKPENTEVEQRWFIGAHANVGGGYGAPDPLADLSLAWMIQKAREAGLKLHDFQAPANAWNNEPKDSYRKFLLGVYKFARWICGRGPHYRSYDAGAKAVGVNLDDSVGQRWHHLQGPPLYRPQTLGNANVIPPPPPTPP
jgi:uncharacterized protein (DUF2235 family)